MNNYSIAYMSESFERKKNTQAIGITLGVAIALLLIVIFTKWPLPTIPPIVEETFIEVDMDIPELPLATIGGGGGGGNPVQATGDPGQAYSPPTAGTEDPADILTDDKNEAAPAVVKPTVPKPDAKTVSNNTSTKPDPKPITTTPAPPRPKATLGKTVGGSSTGGGAAENYDRAGGEGTGSGVGRGSGTGGGSGTGSGGGNGSGRGIGNGPRMVSGNRTIVTNNKMDAGENLKGKVNAEIRVSPDGVGTFVRARQGSRWMSGEPIDIIRDWLRRNRFNKSSEETVVVVEFNFILGG